MELRRKGLVRIEIGGFVFWGVGWLRDRRNGRGELERGRRGRRDLHSRIHLQTGTFPNHIISVPSKPLNHPFSSHLPAHAFNNEAPRTFSVKAQ